MSPLAFAEPSFWKTAALSSEGCIGQHKRMQDAEDRVHTDVTGSASGALVFHNGRGLLPGGRVSDRQGLV